MGEKNSKKTVAGKLVKVAKDYAEKTVGKSIPVSVYEVELPEELKTPVKPDENNQ